MSGNEPYQKAWIVFHIAWSIAAVSLIAAVVYYNVESQKVSAELAKEAMKAGLVQEPIDRSTYQLKWTTKRRYEE